MKQQKLLPLIERSNNCDPLDQEIDKLRLIKQRKFNYAIMRLDDGTKAQDFSSTYFGYDGKLSKASNHENKQKVQSSQVAYRIKQKGSIGIGSQRAIENIEKPGKRSFLGSSKKLTTNRQSVKKAQNLSILDKNASNIGSLKLLKLPSTQDSMQKTLFNSFCLAQGVTLKKM